MLIDACNLISWCARLTSSFQATPMVASVVAKLNEQRLARGGAPLGFLNPWICKDLGRAPHPTPGTAIPNRWNPIAPSAL